MSEYVLVESRAQQVESYRKLPTDGWEQWAFSAGEKVRLDSGVTLDVTEIDEDVEF